MNHMMSTPFARSELEQGIRLRAVLLVIRHETECARRWLDSEPSNGENCLGLSPERPNALD